MCDEGNPEVRADPTRGSAHQLTALTVCSPFQKQACMLIRNLVARSQAFSQSLLDLGAEALITQARATHPDCEDVAKAALRDLGCHVELRELWTGQKGNLAL